MMKTEVFLNNTVSAVCGGKEQVGQRFGIELELEGRNVGLNDVATRGWNRHMEASLRGESIEYTTAGGKELNEAQKLVVDLFSKFAKNEVKFNNSLRTSTHVHLNFSTYTVKQAVNFFSLFTLLEEVLQYYSGEDRKGNLFCISCRDAEGIVGILADGLAKGDLSRFAGDRYKYAACNLSTLYKFGTIEVRTMKGASNAEQVNAWLDILNDMYEYALDRMNSPADLVKDLSFLGAEGLMKKIFKPENFKELMRYFPVIETLHYSLMEGARLIQIFAYEFEDAFNAKVEIKKLPKGVEQLPLQIKEGPHAGQWYTIYKPDGTPWNCDIEKKRGRLHPQFWEDGDRVDDDRRIQWSAHHNRFVVVYPNGDVVLCNWRCHHVIHDEGRPIPRRHMPENGRHDDNDDDDMGVEVEVDGWDFNNEEEEGEEN